MTNELSVSAEISIGRPIADIAFWKPLAGSLRRRVMAGECQCRERNV
jgi:hypothetical protein